MKLTSRLTINFWGLSLEQDDRFWSVDEIMERHLHTGYLAFIQSIVWDNIWSYYNVTL